MSYLFKIGQQTCNDHLITLQATDELIFYSCSVISKLNLYLPMNPPQVGNDFMYQDAMEKSLENVLPIQKVQANLEIVKWEIDQGKKDAFYQRSSNSQGLMPVCFLKAVLK
ncbi:MAG: hypothetical protein H7X88_03055 [Gloeobacteraceae cyanobacterium ES-bin-316]|nr:hypothetical protein [Ferruginibacter sp.]